MIQEQLRKRNIAAGAYLVGMGVLMYRHNLPEYQQHDPVAHVLMYPLALAYIAACWFYLKAKGRSGAWLLLMPLSLIALLVYWGMDDCSEEEENIPCPKCTSANFPDAVTCRLCKTPLAGADQGPIQT